MMGWYRTIKSVLLGEPENWLAYIHGQQIHNLSLLTNRKPRYRGGVVQVAKFAARLVRDTHFKKQPALKNHAKYLIYAGSANEKNSLDKTFQSLKSKEATVVFIASSRILNKVDCSEDYVCFQLSLMDVLRTMLLFISRGYGLYRLVKAIHPVSVNWYFADFCSAYVYLSYFYRVLNKVKPDFVIVSNDHNVQNRCLMALAHQMEIKTVYMQHASVSPIFPALRFNYAFLDGQCALDTYRLCEGNQPETPRNVPIPAVVLSGQKKHLKRTNRCSTTTVGIALNALDNTNRGIELISRLASKGLKVCLRWHPGQDSTDIAKFKSTFADNKKITLSDPKQEPVSDFMENVGWLIAGNSSIHLEAALAGVLPIYYELTPPEHPDYYGYVKHRLVQVAENIEQILTIIKNTQKDHSPDQNAVRYYSATYMTEWDGKEGDLVAECLECLSRVQVLPVEVVDFKASSSRNM